MRRSSVRPLRFLVLMTASAILGSGCDPVEHGAFALAPRAAGVRDTAGAASFIDSVFTTVGGIAGQQGLREFEPPDRATNGWRACYGKETLILCGKVVGNEPQFDLHQWARFAPEAVALRATLLDTLRARFGRERVRECSFRWNDKTHSIGCPAPSPSGG